MPTDVRDVLREAAGRPVEPLDAESIWRRARRQRAAYRGGALLSVVALVVGATIAVPNLLDRRGVDVVNDPPEVESDWQTHRMGDAEFAVPASWPVHDLAADGGSEWCAMWERPALYLNDAADPGPCESDVPAYSPGVHAYDLRDRPFIVPLDGRQRTLIEVNGIEGKWVSFDHGLRGYVFDDVRLGLTISYGADPALAERILSTLVRVDGTVEEWRDVDLGETTISVPTSWEIIDLDEDPIAECSRFLEEPSLYLGTGHAAASCAAPPPGAQMVLGVHAWVPDEAGWDPGGGSDGMVASLGGLTLEWWDNEDGTRRYASASPPLIIDVSYAPDPELAEDVVLSLRRDEDGVDDPSEWRRVDLDEASISVPMTWEVVDLREDATAICSRFLGEPTLYLWQGEFPPSCPAPPPDAPRSVGAHVTRRDAPFDASRGGESDTVISIQSGPTLYERDNGDGTRTYRVDGSTLELHVSYDPDPRTAQGVAHSLRFDETE